MKKTLALLLALLMALACSGCAESLKQIEIPPLPQVSPAPGQELVSEDPGTETESPAPAEETPAPQTGTETETTPAPTVISTPEPAQETGAGILLNVGRTELTDYDPAEGTELILSFSYDMPRLIWEEKPETAQKINEVLATVEETFYTGNSYGLNLSFLGYNAMLETAEDNYSYVKEYQVEGAPLEMSDSLDARVTRLDEGVFSILYSDVCFTGGAHGSYGQFGFSFDMSSGEILTLDMLSSNPEAFSDFLVETMLRMAEEDADGYYSQRIEDSFLPAGGREEAFRSMLRENAWYFDRDGIVIFSNLYELGPYAAGITEFHIPYSELEGRIDSRFLFPGDRQGQGKVGVAELSKVEGGEIPIVDRLCVTEGGAQLCLVADGRVYDLRISRVYYVDRFYEQNQLWGASFLEDCAIQLEVTVPEGLPDLLITYYTADGVRYGKLLSQSGLDGSYMLVDDDIQAVG